MQDAGADRTQPRRPGPGRTHASVRWEIPARLWRALGEAGPRPHPPEALDLSERWWLVEVEQPRDEEPNVIALWEEDGAEVVLAAFLCDDDGGGVSFPTVVTWRTTSEGERSEVGVAVLKGLIKANDPESPESRVGTIQIIDALAAPDSGAIAARQDRHRDAPGERRPGDAARELPGKHGNHEHAAPGGVHGASIDHCAVRDRACAGARACGRTPHG